MFRLFSPSYTMHYVYNAHGEGGGGGGRLSVTQLELDLKKYEQIRKHNYCAPESTRVYLSKSVNMTRIKKTRPDSFHSPKSIQFDLIYYFILKKLPLLEKHYFTLVK